MSGRVLSEEEIRGIDEDLEFGAAWSNATVCDLIATIRDRDKTIAELHAVSKNQQSFVNKAYWDNTIMRKALERAENGLNHLAHGTASDPLLLAQATWERVCEALAKVNGGILDEADRHDIVKQFGGRDA